MEFKKQGREILNHFQSGVSYMIPLVVAAGLLTSIAVIFGGTGVWDQTDTFWGVLRMIGQTGLQFIVPMISAYIAYSIADRPGLAPAFITGMMCQNLGMGFIGGMVAGLACGYLANALKKVKVPMQVISLKSIMLIPFVTTLVVGIILWYVLATPIQAMTTGLTNWLEGMSGANAALMSAILGGMMAFDMGGPINKIAYAFGVASFSSGSFGPSTAMLLGIAIPPFGMFLATILNKKLYDESERDNAKTAMIMGLVGITEGDDPVCRERSFTSNTKHRGGHCSSMWSKWIFWCYSRNNAFNLYGNSFCYEYTSIFSINCYWGSGYSVNGQCTKIHQV